MSNISYISTKKTHRSSVMENCFTNIVYVFICYRLGVIGRSIRIMRIIRGIYLISLQRKHIAVTSQRIVSQILCYHQLQVGSYRKIYPYNENNKRNISHISTKKTYSSSIKENCFTE